MAIVWFIGFVVAALAVLAFVPNFIEHVRRRDFDRRMNRR